MSDPTTTLDPRFSSPDVTATSWADAVRVLESAGVCWLSTVRADGRPHVTPLVAVWLDGALHFSTGDQEQKAVNLRTNPHVVLTTGSNEWDRGLDVVLEGEAVRVTDDATLRRLADAWGATWDGRWQYEVRDGRLQSDPSNGSGADLVFAVAPTKVLAFGRPVFTQTRHDF